MKQTLYQLQWTNHNGISAQHYLVKMVDNILKVTDTNSRRKIVAALLTMIDWKEAFDRQCPTLGVEAFLRCGVRPALIPNIINYFQNSGRSVINGETQVSIYIAGAHQTFLNPQFT